MSDELLYESGAVSILEVGIQGPPGIQGAAGVATVATCVTSDTVLKGDLLTISRSTSQATKADAAVYTKSFVVGFAADDTSAGFVVGIKRGILTLPDWTSSTGAAQLTVGAPYFLKQGGGLTTTRPQLPGSLASTIVGVAVTAQGLYVDPMPPVLL